MKFNINKWITLESLKIKAERKKTREEKNLFEIRSLTFAKSLDNYPSYG